MTWGLWKQKGREWTLVQVYDSKNACLAQLKAQEAIQDDEWRYFCRAR